MAYMLIFLLKNVSSFCICKNYIHFLSKNTCESDIVLTRKVNIFTTNKLVKLTMLWTTEPRLRECEGTFSDVAGFLILSELQLFNRQTKKTTFETLFGFLHTNSFLNGFYSKRKAFAQAGSKVFTLEQTTFQKRCTIYWQSYLSWMNVYPFSFRLCYRHYTIQMDSDGWSSDITYLKLLLVIAAGDIIHNSVEEMFPPSAKIYYSKFAKHQNFDALFGKLFLTFLWDFLLIWSY